MSQQEANRRLIVVMRHTGVKSLALIDTGKHRPGWHHGGRALFLLLALTFPLQVAHAQGTVTVNSLAQRNPPATNGVCTLGAAILTANGNANVDGCTIVGPAAAPYTINIPSGTYVLTVPDPSTGVPPFGLPQPAVNGAITLQGTLAASCAPQPFPCSIIQRSAAGGTPAFGLLSMGGAGPWTVNDLGFQNGKIINRDGGAISFSNQNGLFNLNRSTFLNNSTDFGGGAVGAFNGNISTTVTDSTFTGNSTSNGSGGAILADSGSLSITNSTFSNNTTASNGGAIDTNTGSGISITDSTFLNNSSTGGFGGAIHGALMTVTRSVFIGNSITNTTGVGGAIDWGNGCGGGFGSSSIVDSFFMGNTIASPNPTCGGGAAVSCNQCTISGSTFQGNNAGGGPGGAITAGGSTIINSTFSGNMAASDGGAINSSGTNTFNNVTVTNNTSSSGSGGVNFRNGDVIRNSIMTGNSGADCARSGTPTSQGHNILGINCGVTASTGDQFGTAAAPLDPALDRLKTNFSLRTAGSNVGGQSPMVIPTFALLIGSTALNMGDPGTTDGLLTHCLPFDERGSARGTASAGLCDIGAFESASGTGFTPTADVSITLSAAPGTVVVGGRVTYTAVASNAGPDPASGLVFTLPLPAGMTFASLSWSSSEWSCTVPLPLMGGTVTCTKPSFNFPPPPATFTLAVNATTPGTLTATATLSTTGTDANQANNSAMATTIVTPSGADLALTKTGAPGTVNVGQNVTYTLTVTNNGPSTALGVILTDTLPTTVTFVSATPSQGAACTQAAGIVTCNLGTINNAANATATIVVTPLATAVPSITNTATVAATNTDPNMANNTASATTTVNPSADLSVTKTGAPPAVNVGSNVTYTVTVTNNGPSTAAAVTLTDTLPANVTFVSATPSVGTCALAAGVVTCNLLAMNNAATATVTIVVTPTGAAVPSITNTATVSSTTSDPNMANNSASATTTVNPVADLALAKAASPNPVPMSGALTYTLTVTNGGPNNSAGVVLTDPLPAGVTFGSAVASQGSCAQASGTVTCNLGTINNGATATVTIMLTAPVTAGSITNTATVTATTTDTNMANNSASQTTTVSAAGIADFSLSVVPSSQTVKAGKVATYTLTATSLNSFTGTVNLTCGQGPMLTLCLINPTSVVIPSGGMISSAVTIATVAPGSSGPRVMGNHDGLRGIGAASMAALLLLLFTLMAMRNTGAARRWRWTTVTLRLAAIVVLCVFASSCDQRKGTPKGSSSITVTGTSGTLTHAINLTLVVQ